MFLGSLETNESPSRRSSEPTILRLSSANHHTSMFWLIGKQKWTELNSLLQGGTYDDKIREKEIMAMAISFAIHFDAPTDTMRILCNGNPDALTLSRQPFHLARKMGQNAHILAVMHCARQQALVNRRVNPGVVEEPSKADPSASLTGDKTREVQSLQDIIPPSVLSPLYPTQANSKAA